MVETYLNLLLPNDLSNHPSLKKMRTGGLANFRRFLPFPIIFHPVWEQNGLRTTPYHFSFPPPFQKKVPIQKRPIDTDFVVLEQ